MGYLQPNALSSQNESVTRNDWKPLEILILYCVMMLL